MENVAEDGRPQVRPLEDYRPAASELLIYHYSIQTRATDAFRRSPARKVVIYHNITPASFFRPYDERLAQSLDDGRRELASTASVAFMLPSPC